MTHGFFLHASNRTEDLLENLAAVLQRAPQKSLFGAELILIQSQGMERVVSQNLADHFGSFCNFRFYLPLNFLGHIASLLAPGISSGGFDRGILTWRLEALLRDCDGEKYKPLHRYLHGAEPSRRRYQLARRIADIFDQYQLMRSKMVLDWGRIELLFSTGRKLLLRTGRWPSGGGLSTSRRAGFIAPGSFSGLSIFSTKVGRVR